MSKKKPATKKPAKKRSAPKTLNEKDSAIVIAEYLSIEKVSPPEIDKIVEGDGHYHPTYRETALVFRISEVLGIPCCFKIAPKYRTAFARAQEYVRLRNAAGEAAREAGAS